MVGVSGVLNPLAHAETRSPTHKAHPYARRGEFDGCEEVRGVLFVAGCDGAVMLDLVEKALDEVASLVEARAEGWRIDAMSSGRMLAAAPWAAIIARGASLS